MLELQATKAPSVDWHALGLRAPIPSDPETGDWRMNCYPFTVDWLWLPTGNGHWGVTLTYFYRPGSANMDAGNPWLVGGNATIGLADCAIRRFASAEAAAPLLLSMHPNMYEPLAPSRQLALFA